MLSESVARVTDRYHFDLIAFVWMPEHVHLLVLPLNSESRISSLLTAIKRPFSYRIKQLLAEAESPLLDRLTVHQRPGVRTFRFWQEGGGYDRNFDNPAAIRAAIDYIHMNPVRRDLCEKPSDWRWSSARFYDVAFDKHDGALPPVSGLNWQIVE